VWPIEERPVPASDVPGEKASPTQPHPTKPPAYDRQGLTVDDLIDFTPELRASAEKLIKDYEYGHMYTPPVVSTWPRPLGTIFVPHILGGANWPGGSYDPETQMLYMYSITQAASIGLVKPDPGRSDMRYVVGVSRDPNAAPAAEVRGAPAGGEGGRALMVEGLPILKPPYGRITAYDMNKGEIVWQMPHGDTPDNIKNHPKLKGINIPRTAGRVASAY
jgi:quinoprotein glucose dehydrogenase